MATKLQYAAQMAMDLYYQDYAPRNAFFDMDSFMFQFAITYSEMLDAEFQAQRVMGKQETGFANIEISSAWLVEELLTTQYVKSKDKVCLYTSTPIYSFKWDSTGNALQGIRPVSGKNRYRKISLNEIRFDHIVPTSSFIYYYLNNGKEIEFVHGIPEQEVIAKYVPVVVGNDPDCVLADGIVAAVIKETLTVMFGAKNGNIVQMANDGNSNTVMQQQVNSDLNKQ